MTERLAELRDSLTRDYEEMRALFSRLREADLRERAANGWTVAQVAGHIAVTPDGDMWLLDRLRKGRGAKLPGPFGFLMNTMINTGNRSRVRAFRKATKDDLLRALELGHNKLFAYVNGLSDEELDRGGEVFRLGRFTVYEYVLRRGDHPREHAATLRDYA